MNGTNNAHAASCLRGVLGFWRPPSPVLAQRLCSSRRNSRPTPRSLRRAHAQNLAQQAQQLPQHPVGFADIVAKVKPAVISVRVKVEKDVTPGLSGDETPFPPGSPFDRFFRRFGIRTGEKAIAS